MSNSKLKPIWYGQKTFEILEGFNHQGVSLYSKGLFSCDKETYEDNKQFLGEEYIVKSLTEIGKSQMSMDLANSLADLPDFPE